MGFLCTQFNQEIEMEESWDGASNSEMPAAEKLGRKRLSFLVVHDISDQSPYAILKVPENATTKEVIKQAVMKGGLDRSKEHEYVLLEEVVNAATASSNSNAINNNSPSLPTPN